jgi:transcription initiation factor TFIIB
MEPEWNGFSHVEQSKSRIGLGYSYAVYDKGLSTMFGGYRDATGKTLKDETLRTMTRLRMYDNRSKLTESWRRNLSNAMAVLDRMSDELHLPSVVKEKSAVLYRRILKKNLIKGRSIDVLVAACIYSVCRQSGRPRQLKEIVFSSRREQNEVAKYYRFVVNEMGLKMPVDSPIKFVSKIASKLEVSMVSEHRAVEILLSAQRLKGISGKNPVGIAAAALFIACQENNEMRDQKNVAMAAGTSSLTLRTRLRDLELLLVM